MNPRIDQLKEFLKEDPNDSFLIYALSLEYVKENQVNFAIETLLDLNNRNPNYLAVYYQLGKLYQSMGEIEKATVFFDKGMILAKKEGNIKTFSELKEAKNVMLDIDEFDELD
jgi:tetratricopeptide (TPR) repeat protein